MLTKGCAMIAAGLSKKIYRYRMQPVEYSFLNYSDKFRKVRAQVVDFMERYCFGNEMTYHK